MEDGKRKLKAKAWPLTGMIAFALLLATACGSGEIDTARNSTRAPNVSSQTNSGGANADFPNSNLVNANHQRPMNRKLQRIEQMRASAANSASNAPPVTARPAAENSEITIELRDVARETRTFRDHPSIVSVQRVTNGSQVTVFVTLRDGRRVEIPSRSVQNIEKVTTSELLRQVEAAGSRTAETKRPPPRTKKEN